MASLGIVVGGGAWMLLAVVVVWATDRLRARRLIICREAYLVRAATYAVGGLGYSLVVARFGRSGWDWHMFGLSVGTLVVVSSAFEWLEHDGIVRRAWQHRKHDEDCEFGSRRRRGGVVVRLRGWHKVALRPGLAPS